MVRVYQLNVTIVTDDDDNLDIADDSYIYHNRVQEWVSNVLDDAAQDAQWLREFAVNFDCRDTEQEEELN